MVKVGDRAPEIDAVASDGARFVLSQQSGLCTVIYFFPKAFTPGCTVETRQFRDNYAEIALAGAALVGISTDDLSTQCQFASSLKAPFPMIGDADRRIAEAYGVLRSLIGVARRVTFVVTPDMVVQAVFEHEFRVKKHRDDVLAFVNRRFLAMRPADVAGARREAPSASPPSAPPSAPPATPARPAAAAATVRSQSAFPTALREAVGGRFDIERRAASGASGDIYRAVDRVTGKPVALKLLRRGPARDDARFEREARILAELRHPGIVAYVAHGIAAEGDAYLATEWLDGESLSKRLSREPRLTLAETLTLCARVATTLGAAHERGIIHRDLTPSNLFLPGGVIAEVKLLDFGVSRPAAVGNQLTVPGDVIGTPGYMAPEQARGSSELDARADVFSLGCLLFRCLAGRPPFEGRDMVTMLLAVVTQEPPPVRDLNPAVPEALSDLVARMLSKTPSGRPLDGNAVAAELARIAPS